MDQSRTTPERLGARVKLLRKEAGFSIRKLAKLAGVDFSWLARIERGAYDAPDPRYLRALATALKVEASDLYLAAGYEDSQSLPGFSMYLRAKFDLPPEAIDQLDAHFQLINERYGGGRVS